MPTRRHPEDDLQRAVCAFLDRALVPPAFYFAVPNGGKRNAREAARMKSMGVKAGAPDLLVFNVLDGAMCVIGIELKAGKNKMTAAQEAMADKFCAINSHVHVCYSLNEVANVMLGMGVRLKARPT